MEALNFLLYPFLGCVALILIHAYFGVHILERGIIFVDIALAQFIGIGIALSFFFGHENSYWFSIAFAVIGAFILALSKKIAKSVNIEAFIGVLYMLSFAASILILDKSPHGEEEFKAILSGNILWLTQKDVLSAFIFYGILGGFHFVFRKNFMALSFDGSGSLVMGVPFLSQLCPCSCQISTDGRDTTGLFLSHCTCPDRQALHPKTFQGSAHRMDCRALGERHRHRYII